MKKYEILILVIFIFVAIVTGYLVSKNNKELYKQQSLVSAKPTIYTGTVEIWWDEPTSLVSMAPFSVTYGMDVKLVNENETIYFNNVDFMQTINESVLDINNDGFIDTKDLTIVKNEFGLTGTVVSDINGDEVVDIFDVVLVAYESDEPGTGLFSTIVYTVPVVGNSYLNYEEWVRPRWSVTGEVYLESTGEIFTNTVWSWHDGRNKDNYGYFYNQLIQLDWPYRTYLPVIMKGS